MARSAAQSDFVVHSQEAPPSDTEAAELPKATWRSNFASQRATTLVYWFVGLSLLLLVILTVVGPHIPSGE